MEKHDHLSPRATGGCCIITGHRGAGPYVDVGEPMPFDSDDYGTRAFVSQKAVIAMAKALGLPAGSDVSALEREVERLTAANGRLVDEVESLQRIIAMHRRVLGLDGVPSPEELDEAEAVMAEAVGVE